jgi:hypothetical protein
LYFVDEPFTYKTLEEIPAEPEVYYFPSTLVTMTGEAFDGSRLNDYVVFPAGLTDLSDGYTFEGSASNSGKPTVILLGDMQAVTISSWGVKEIYFCNPADIDATSASLSGTITAHYCNAEGNTDHIRSPRLDDKTPADCDTPEISLTYCFCGYALGRQETAPAFGHKSDLTVVGWNYNGNYFANANLVHICTVCEEEYDGETVENSALFEALGYSASEDDATGITYEVYVNTNTVKEFKKYDPTAEIYYGIIVSAVPSATPLTYANNEVVAGTNTVKIDMTGSVYNKITTKITNLPADITLNCSGFVCVDGVISYLNHETSDKEATIVSHAYVINLKNGTQGGEGEGDDEGTETPAE